MRLSRPVVSTGEIKGGTPFLLFGDFLSNIFGVPTKTKFLWGEEEQPERESLTAQSGQASLAELATTKPPAAQASTD